MGRGHAGGRGYNKVLRKCLLTDAEKLDLEIHYFILQRTKIIFFLKKKKSVSCFPLPEPCNGFGKIVILPEQQHNFMKWHSTILKPGTVWREGGRTGPSPVGTGSDCA